MQIIKSEKMKKLKIANYIFNILFIAILFNNNILYSQTKDTPQQKEEEKVEELKAVPVIEIPQSIEKAYVYLNGIESKPFTSKPIDELQKELKSLLSRDSTLKTETKPKLVEEFSTKKLEDFNNKWNSYLNSIRQYKQELEDNAENITKIKDEYKNFDEKWELTYENARKEKVPRALIDRLNKLNRDVKKIDKKLTKALNEILLLRDKVSSEEIKTKENISLIEEEITAHKSMLFSLDSAPIWYALSDSSDTTTISERLIISQNNISNAYTEFYARYKIQILYYFIFFLIVFIIVVYLKKSANANAEKLKIAGNKSSSLNVLNKPFFVALFITLFISGLFFPLAPRIVNGIFSIAFIIPLLALLPTYVPKESRGALYFTSSIYLLQQILELGFFSPTNLRFFVIFLTILSIIAFTFLFQLQIPKLKDDRNRFFAVIRVLAKIMIFTLILSLVANVIGSTKLSELVLNGVMSGIYHTLLLATAYQVFKVLLNIFLETDFANLFLMVQNKRNILNLELLKVAKLILYITGIVILLDGFGLYEWCRDTIVGFLEIAIKIGETSIAVGSIFLFFISIWVSVQLSGFIRFILDDEILPRVHLPRGVPAAISLMVKYVILALGFIFALVAVGFDLSKFAIVAGALGVGIGFGLQNIVNNFISGIILLFERPIQVGDTISIQNLSGVVKRIGIRSSVIAGWDGAEEIVPNADLVSLRVTNWTLSNRNRRIDIQIGVAYGNDVEKVMELLRYSISSRDDVLKEPASYVLFNGYSASTMDFSFRFWISNTSDWIYIKSDVFVHINALLTEAGIEIPFPQMDVRIKNTEEKKEIDDDEK